jgi:accessory gene regulator B
MYLCEKLAVRLAKHSKHVLNVNEEKQQIIKYGAINLFQNLFAIFWIILFGLIFNVLYEALIFSLVVSILRKYSGGVHASSPTSCIFIGTTLSILCGLAVDRLLYSIPINIIIPMSIFSSLFSFIIVYRKAPVDSIKKPISNVTMKKKFKINSILTIIFMSIVITILFVLNAIHSKNFYIKTIECISLGLVWQSLTLTKMLSIFYTITNFILRKGGRTNEKQNS